MSLANYGDLKTSVASWLGRADLTTPIPDFILLAHKQLMRDLRGNLRFQKRDAAFAVSAEYVPVPVDFLELVSAHLNTSPIQPLEFMPAGSIAKYATGTDTPKYIALGGSTAGGAESFRFAPVPSGSNTATIEYVASLPFFPNDTATNWILTDHPHLYLFGSLLAASAFIGDDARIGLWKAGYDEALAMVKSEGKRTRWGGNGMTVRAG
jgi:hypothetical protein